MQIKKYIAILLLALIPLGGALPLNLHAGKNDKKKQVKNKNNKKDEGIKEEKLLEKEKACWKQLDKYFNKPSELIKTIEQLPLKLTACSAAEGFNWEKLQDGKIPPVDKILTIDALNKQIEEAKKISNGRKQKNKAIPLNLTAALTVAEKILLVLQDETITDESNRTKQVLNLLKEYNPLEEIKGVLKPFQDSRIKAILAYTSKEDHMLLWSALNYNKLLTTKALEASVVELIAEKLTCLQYRVLPALKNQFKSNKQINSENLNELSMLFTSNALNFELDQKNRTAINNLFAVTQFVKKIIEKNTKLSNSKQEVAKFALAKYEYMLQEIPKFTLPKQEYTPSARHKIVDYFIEKGGRL